MTHRVEKHITSKNFVIRVCKTSEGYLDWVRNVYLDISRIRQYVNLNAFML